MNTVLLNTVNLDDGRIIKKGGSGGVTIKNQTKSVTIAENGNTVVSYDSGYTGLEKVSVKVAIPNEEKTVEITENGTTEVVADNGFLSKVVVNTNVASGGEEDYNDGKTRLWLVGAWGDIQLHFSQSIANGVTVDWGDGISETFSETSVTATHKYKTLKDVVITLDASEGCILTLGKDREYFLLGGSADYNGDISINQMLQKVHVGKGVNTLTAFCLGRNSYNLELVVSGHVKKIEGNQNAGYGIIKGGRVTLMEGIEIIDACSFYTCQVNYLKLPSTITAINGSYVFYNWYGSVVDFSRHTFIPSLERAGAFGNTRSSLRIVVPDALYDGWISATNWSSYAAKIVKASEFDA